MRLLTSLTVFPFVAIAASCQLARSKSSVSFAPDFLQITGRADASDGLSLGAPEIFLGLRAQPVGVGESDGSFDIKVDSRTLMEWQAQNCGQVRIQSPIGRSIAVSALVTADPAARGSLSIGSLKLKKPGSVKGTVGRYTQGSGNSTGKALAGASITLACSSVVTDGAGHFELKDVPAGTYKLKIHSPGLSDFQIDLLVEEGKSTELKNGVMLYPPGVIDGSAVVASSYSLSDLIAAGTPYRRTFGISYSVDVAYVRMDKDKSALMPDMQGNVRAPWIPIQGSLDYDFSENGDANLYYQFASSDKQTVSIIRNTVVALDLLSVSTGFVIGDGSGKVNSRYVTLKIDVPPIAKFMRIAQVEADLQKAEWHPVQPLLDYAIVPTSNDIVNQSIGSSSFLPSVSGPRQVFLQFSDGISKGDKVAASESKVFRSAAVVDLFPASSTPVFTVNHGAATTNSNFVRIDIRVPANAWQMRIFEDNQSTSTSAIFGSVVYSSTTQNGIGDWMPANPLFFYAFKDSGLKGLNLQFRDIGGFNSPVYMQNMRVEPFPPGSDPFVINGGAPYTNYRDLLLSITPPTNSIVFRVSENLTDMSASGRIAFLELVTQYPYMAQGTGLRTIYMQFADKDGNTSPAYSKSIYVSPFTPIAGDFHINRGAPASLVPRLLLDIIPPPAAREMAIADRPFAPQFSSGSSSGVTPQWRPVGTSAEYLSVGRGLKTIYLKFRTDGDSPIESSVLVRNIIYDPFPPGSVDLLVNGGAAVTFLPVLNIDIVAPPTAYSMSWGVGREELPSLNTLSLFEQNLIVQLPRLPGIFHFCLRVDNVDGDFSTAVCKTIQLVLFPVEKLTLSLNGEAPLDPAPSKVGNGITFGLNPPLAAEVIQFQEVQLTEVAASFPSSVAWVRLPQIGEAALTMNLTGGVGMKRICARYGSGVGLPSGTSGSPSPNPQAISATFCKNIEITP